MTPSLLRQVWSRVEETHANLLLQLDDTSLIELLLTQIKDQQQLNRSEVDLIYNYIKAKISLIRDLAYSRLVGSSH